MARAKHLTQPELIIRDLKDFGLPEIPCLGRFCPLSARPALERHTHPGAMEICFLVKGRQIYRVGGHDYVLRGNDVYVTFADEPHGTGGHPQSPCILYWLQVRLPPAKKPFLAFKAEESAALVDPLRKLRRRLFPGSPELKACFEAAYDACLRGGRAQRVALSIHLGRLFLELLDCAARESSSPSESTNHILNYIKSHLEENLSIDELSQSMGLSESWFKARFRKEMGMPPREYMLREKIERAKLLLRGGGHSVTDVAMELGFSSSQYFATVFKRFTRELPRAYLPRKNLRATSAH